MALNTKTVSKAKLDAAKANLQVEQAAPAMLSVELAKITRLHVMGTLFEKGKVYTLNQSDAERLLALEYDEVPAFKRHRGAVAATQASAPVTVSQGVVLPTAVELTPEAPASIEIGSVEEMAELGLGEEDESDEEAVTV